MNLSTEQLIRDIYRNNRSKGIALENDLLNRYQRSLIKIAEDIIEVCNECGAVYYLVGGSCLGAVRHEGFIPWDDDLDIGIPNEDFDVFIKAFSKKYSSKYWIHTPKTRSFPYTQICLKGSIFRGYDNIGDDECGFFVDIFKIENVPNNAIAKVIHGVLCLGMGFLCSCRHYYSKKKQILSLCNGNKNAERIFRVKIAIGRCTTFLSSGKLCNLTDKCYGLCKNKKSKYINIPSGRKHYFGDMYLRDDFVGPSTLSFEKHNWNVPHNPDAYLTKLYGDYMTIPPESKREQHFVIELKFPEDI